MLGVRPGFFEKGTPFPTEDNDRIWLGAPLAAALAHREGDKVVPVREGDKVVLYLQKQGEVPRESVLGKKDAALDEWELTVGGVLGADIDQGHHPVLDVHGEMHTADGFAPCAISTTPSAFMIAAPLLATR